MTYIGFTHTYTLIHTHIYLYVRICIFTYIYMHIYISIHNRYKVLLYKLYFLFVKVSLNSSASLINWPNFLKVFRALFDKKVLELRTYVRWRHFIISFSHINLSNCSLKCLKLDQRQGKCSSSARLHIWKVGCFRWTLSHFPVTAANLHEADLNFVIAVLCKKFLMLTYFWRLQLNL